jgi:hypothetical protein
MLRKLRSRITYANVVATLALFVAVGTGGAYAANTVFSSDIVDGEVKSVDIGDGEIKSADVKDQSLTTFDVSTFLGADVVDNTLTGADVDESTLNLATESWHEVGAAGEPAFNSNIFCFWRNFIGDNNFNTAAFVRDRGGFVHLKGIVDAEEVPGNPPNSCTFSQDNFRIFSLPAGYRPVKREVDVTLSNSQLGRVSIDGPDFGYGPGAVRVETPTTVENMKNFVALDGITFRCAPSGLNGCP